MIRATLKFRGKFVRDYTVNKPSAIIGRDPSVDIKIENKGVLPKYCKITQRGAKYLIEDLGTPEGIDLNGEKIRMAQIKGGDLLNLGGNFTLEFDFSQGQGQSQQAPQNQPQQAPRKSGGLPGDGQKPPTPTPPPTPVLPPAQGPISPLSSGKSAEFFSEATMRVSAFSENMAIPTPMADDDIEIEPLSLGDLSDDFEDSGNRRKTMEKINGMLMTLSDSQLHKVAQILEILFG